MEKSRKRPHPSYQLQFREEITIIFTIGQLVPSEHRRSAIDLAIIREDLQRPRMFLRWVDGKAQVADALTKLHAEGDLLRAGCRQALTVLVETTEIMAAVKKRGNGKE